MSGWRQYFVVLLKRKSFHPAAHQPVILPHKLPSYFTRNCFSTHVHGCQKITITRIIITIYVNMPIVAFAALRITAQTTITKRIITKMIIAQTTITKRIILKVCQHLSFRFSSTIITKRINLIRTCTKMIITTLFIRKIS